MSARSSLRAPRGEPRGGRDRPRRGAERAGPAADPRFLTEKASRTPAQRKLATALLYASRESRRFAMVHGLQPLRRIANRASVQTDGMVVVDIRGEVTDALLQRIAEIGAASPWRSRSTAR